MTVADVDDENGKQVVQSRLQKFTEEYLLIYNILSIA